MKRKNILLFFVLIALYAGFAGAAEQDRKGKIVLFPFNVEEAGKYSALRDGLRSILAGRLAGGEGVSVLVNTLGEKEQQMFIQTYPENSASVFEKLGAGHIGLVTMALSGEQLHLQISIFTEGETSPVMLKSYAENENEVIHAVQMLSDETLQKFFAVQPASRPKDNGGSVGSVNEAQRGVEAFQTTHPERRFKEDIIAGTSALELGGGIIVSPEHLVRRRASIDEDIISLVLEDIDGDGIAEIVTVSSKGLKIFHYDRGITTELAEYRFKPGLQVHAVNTADMDGDGVLEMYLSAVEDDRFASMILRWLPHSGFQVMGEDIRWALRPLDIPGEGRVLVGQTTVPLDASFLAQEIVVLKYDAVTASIETGRQLVLPPGINLFDFIYADVDGDGLAETVAVTSNLKLAVYDTQNRPVWRSENDFGGSKTYLGSRWRQDTSVLSANSSPDGESYLSLQYIPVRLVAKDINNDGKVEILSAQNNLSTFRMLKNLRSFSGGKVVCLSWSGYALQELWTTDNLDGYVADFAFVSMAAEPTRDLKQTGKTEEEAVRLVIGQMPGAGPIDFLDIFSGTGNLVIYDFNIADKTAVSQDNGE